MIGLTKQQYRAKKFISDHIRRNGYAPTLAEIAKAVNVLHRSRAKRIVDGLAERGHIKRIAGKHRSLEVVNADG